MSKYSKSGKRSHAGAGNHFDKLLKVCNNSKVAGSIGRFGVASFTSLRTNVTNEVPEEEKKPKSKYSSFKKRARLDPSANKSEPPPPSSVYGSLGSQGSSAVSTGAGPVAIKPRKFFKSRGPIDPNSGITNQIKPIRPDIGSLLPPQLVTSPLIPSNTNTNSKYPGREQIGHHKKHKKNSKKHENLSSPPQNLPSGSSSESFISPPIKLRIFKDRGKLVAESSSTNEATPIVPPDDPLLGKKRGRRPGSKNKKGFDDGSSFDDQQPVKQTKRAKQASQVTQPSQNATAAGRTTRNSKRRQENSESDSGMPSLDRELRNSIDGNLTSESTEYQPQPPQLMVNTCEIQQELATQIANAQPTQEIIKKLEEDADFKKLSEMLSSMENDGVPGDSGNYSQNQTAHGSQQAFESVQGYHGQQGNIETYPVNVNMNHTGNNGAPPGMSAFAAQAFMQQQFRQQMQQEDQSVHHQQQQQQHQSQAYYNSNLNMGYQDQTHGSAELPQQQNIPKANDIRSILVDDWTDFDDETHSPTGHRSRPSSQASHHSQSPPKFSRFDMSAFMPTGGNVSKDQQQPSPQFPPQDAADQIDHFSVDQQQLQQQQQMQFNIHSSPYAMRNLLNCPPGHDPQFALSQQDLNHQQQLPGSAANFSSCALESLQQHHLHHHAPLTSLSSGAKQEAISVLDSVLKQQQLSNDLTPGIPHLPQLPLVQPKTQVAPSTRKASIFKSRAREQNQNGEGDATKGTSDGAGSKGGSKRLALYRHKFAGQEDASMEEHNRQQQSQAAAQVFNEFDEELEDENVRLRNVRIKNTKAVHQLQESGEFHEFDGDVQYILEDLRNKNPMNIRCLSAVTLATRCMEPSFRMHLRAHGTVAEFCRELHDSPQHPELAQLAALVLFVLSQDRLNMDLDTDTLKLILALSKAEDCNDPESQTSQDAIQAMKHRQKVLDLCVEMKNRGHATHLKLDKITASELALETLLHLTSKRAGEWVKHELRALGGLDSIVNEVDSSLRYAQVELSQFGWSEAALERLRKVDRCLQVLQQVTFNHEHNQKYLLGHSDREVETAEGGIIRQKCVETSPKIFVDLFKFCKDNILQLPIQLESASVMREMLFSVLRVLVNLSHDYRGIVLGSEILLAMDGFLTLCLHSTFEMGHYFPDEKIFDLLMHSFCMLLNLVEHSRPCRNAILSSTVQKSSAGNYRVPDPSSSMSSEDSGVHEEISVLDAFVEMFLCRERAAKKEEQHTDNILTKGPEDANSSSPKTENGSQDKNSQDSEGSSLQDTIDKLIQTAGKHMENSLIAAYIALMLAYLIMDAPVAANQVRQSMPNGKYLPLMTFLKKLFNFMSITSSASGSIRGLKATSIALRFFGKADPGSEEELKRLIPD